METRNLEAFILAAERGSFAAAGRDLEVPASTVSRAVDRLEAHLGVRLFHRTTHGLTLAPAGQLCVEHAREILAHVFRLEEEASDTRDSIAGKLRIALPTVKGQGAALDRLLSAFAMRHPEVNVEASVSNRTIDLLGEGFDLALRNSRRQDDRLVYKRLREVQWRAFASPGYLSSAEQIDDADDLLRHACLALSAAEGFVRWSLLSGGHIEFEPRIRSDELNLLASAAIEGVGVALLPTELVARHVEKGVLQPVLPEQVGEADGLYVAYPASRPVPARTLAFVAFATDFFAT